MHLIHLLSILLKYKGFASIQETIVDQTSNRPRNSYHDLLWGQVGASLVAQRLKHLPAMQEAWVRSLG